MISFYCIAKRSRLSVKPWANWIQNAGEKRFTGARFGWLWIDVEINYYDRNKHLRLILNEYRDRNDYLLQNEQRSKNMEACRQRSISQWKFDSSD